MFYRGSLRSLDTFLRTCGALLFALVSTASLPSFALRTDAEQPIHIEGDNAEIDQTSETIVYTGAVQVAQGTMRVLGDRMVVKISDDQVEQITTLGSPARYKQELEDNQGEVEAEADAIIYHTSQERIYLQGGATLTQMGNKLMGESIHYDIVNGAVDANAGKSSSRVRMIFDPNSQPATIKRDTQE